MDPKRVYVSSAGETPHEVLEVEDGKKCWWQCTVKVNTVLNLVPIIS